MAKKASAKKSASAADVVSEINALKGNRELITSVIDGKFDYDERIPTGVRNVDKALGGGIPKGTWVHVVGNPGGGKSALALKFAGEAQAHGKVLWIDAERQFDKRKALNSGIDIEELLIARTSRAEEALNAMRIMVRSHEVSAVILDSIGVLIPDSKAAGDVGDSSVASLARVVTDALQMLNDEQMEHGTDTIIMFVNHVKSGIGPMAFPTSPGGKALKYLTSTDLRIDRFEKLSATSGGEKSVYAQVSKVRVEKARFTVPFQETKFEIDFVDGVNNAASLLDDLIKHKRVTVASGGHHTDVVKGAKLGQGRRAVTQLLAQDEDYCRELEEWLESET